MTAPSSRQRQADGRRCAFVAQARVVRRGLRSAAVPPVQRRAEEGFVGAGCYSARLKPLLSLLAFSVFSPLLQLHKKVGRFEKCALAQERKKHGTWRHRAATFAQSGPLGGRRAQLNTPPTNDRLAASFASKMPRKSILSFLKITSSVPTPEAPEAIP